MTIRKIAKMGHSVLRQIADEVPDPTSLEMQSLIEDMIETLQDAGGVGLAAPQVHEPWRVLIFFVPKVRMKAEDGDGAEAIPLTILFNPVIEPLSDEQSEDWEGCLSVPGLRGLVPRYSKIRYSGLDRDGKPFSREARGFHARVVQHEFDHLEGKTYLQQMTDLGKLTFESEMKHMLDIPVGPIKSL